MGSAKELTVVVGAPLGASSLPKNGLLLLVEADLDRASQLKEVLAGEARAVVFAEVLATEEGAPVQWHCFNDARLNGPAGLAAWKERYPNLQLVGEEQRRGRSLEGILNDWAQQQGLPDQLGLHLEVLQGDPLAAVMGLGPWLAGLQSVQLDTSKTAGQWHQPLDALLTERGLLGVADAPGRWQRDPVVTLNLSLQKKERQLAELEEQLSTHAARLLLAQTNHQELAAELDQLRVECDGLTVERDGLVVERDGLTVERDGLVVERDGLTVERDGLVVERDGLTVERDGLVVERDGLTVERDGLVVERDGLTVERDGLVVERDGLTVERDGLVVERDGLTVERDGLVVERDGLTVERDGLVVERDGLTVERDGLVVERDGLTVERDGLVVERDGLTVERDGLVVERDGLTVERDGLVVERDGLTVERDGLVVERDGLTVERDGLVVERDGLTVERDGLVVERGALLIRCDHLEDKMARINNELDEILSLIEAGTRHSGEHSPVEV